MRAEQGSRRPSSRHGSLRRLPVSRKATHPRRTRVEGIVLFLLVLGLSLLVFVGVSGATRSGAVAACSANATAVSSGIAALKAENSGGLGFPTTAAGWERALITGGQYIGSPFLTSWPRSQDYAISVAGVGTPADSGDALTPRSGDVLVTVLAKGLVYDATSHLGTACASV